MRIRIVIFGILTFAFLQSRSQQLITFTGKVTNTQSVPVAGSTVNLLNTNRGAASDEQGNFSLKNIAAGKYTVQVTAIGYATISMDVILKNATESLNIQLEDASRQLDAVLV